ncbi:MAG: CPBP family intramembrane glutamic endopeptidase [Bacteroidota bacterium]
MDELQQPGYRQNEHSRGGDLAVEAQPPESQVLTDRLSISPILYGIIALLVTLVLYQFIGGVITFVLVGADVTDENVDRMRVATMVGHLLLLLVPTFILLKVQTSRVREFIRWKRPSGREVFFVLVSVFALQQILQAYMYLQEQIPLPESVEPFLKQFREFIEATYKTLVMADSLPELLFVVVVVAIVPAVTEEILFRGLVQRNFELGFKGIWGVVVAGAVFGVYHFNPFSLVPLAVLGVFFGYVVYRSGSIVNAILGHFFNNFLAILAIFYGVDEELLVQDGSAGEVDIQTFLINVVLFGGLFLGSTFGFVKSTALRQRSFP